MPLGAHSGKHEGIYAVGLDIEGVIEIRHDVVGSSVRPGSSERQ